MQIMHETLLAMVHGGDKTSRQGAGMMPCDTEKNSTPCVKKSWAMGGEEHASVHGGHNPHMPTHAHGPQGSPFVHDGKLGTFSTTFKVFSTTPMQFLATLAVFSMAFLIMLTMLPILEPKSGTPI